jgi:protein SCO1
VKTRFAIPILIALLASAAAASDVPFRAGVFDPPREAPEISLQGSDGQQLRLDRFRGKVVIVGFGFTSCPQVCPTTLATLAQARRKLGAQRDDVQVVYITVDPERDGVARLREYLGGFDPTFIGGTGTAQQLETLRTSYGITAKREGSGDGYGYSHSSYTYLIDRAGRMRALMPYGRSADDYVHDVRLLLQP